MTDNQNDKKKKEEEDRSRALNATYSQASEFDRHYDRMSWIILSIVTSAMVATTAFVGSNVGEEFPTSPFNNPLVLSLVGIATLAVYVSFLRLPYKLGELQKRRTRDIIVRMYVDSKIDPPPGKDWKGIWEINNSWVRPFVVVGVILVLYWIMLILVVLKIL